MEKCYNCGKEEDYTDQFAVPKGAACRDCYLTHHVTPEKFEEIKAWERLQEIKKVIDNKSTSLEKINMIHDIIHEA